MCIPNNAQGGAICSSKRSQIDSHHAAAHSPQGATVSRRNHSDRAAAATQGACVRGANQGQPSGAVACQAQRFGMWDGCYVGAVCNIHTNSVLHSCTGATHQAMDRGALAGLEVPLLD